MPNHWKLLCDRDFLGAVDIDNGRDVIVTIAKVEGGQIARAGTGKKDRKPVITFQGKAKKWVCNTTNCKTIEALAGTPDYTRWSGLRLSLYCTDTVMSGKPCRGIRVRPVAPGARAADNLPEPPPPDIHAELSGIDPTVPT